MAAARAAGHIYTLDFDEDAIQMKVDDEVLIDGAGNPIGKLPLSQINSISGSIYANGDMLIKDQQIWNFLDAVKDGIKKEALVGLSIYPKAVGIVNPKETLHQYENSLLNRLTANLLRHTWTETKKGSKLLERVEVHNYLWESGLGYDRFMKILPEGSPTSIATFGSYIDPLSKPGISWPPRNSDIVLTESLMKHTGFGESFIHAITADDDGRYYQYDMNIKCGTSCSGNTCKVNHNTEGLDPNIKLFRGNNEKDKLLKQDILLKKSGLTREKTKVTVMKGWGDKIQVLIYYMYYHLQKESGRSVVMITCDMVVYSLCMTLSIPCIYTGMYDRPVKVDTRDVSHSSESFYSILKFTPGTTEENIKQLYLNKITKVFAENKETIESMERLQNHPDTPIDIQGKKETFPASFYRDIIADMNKINKQLDEQRAVPLVDFTKIDDIIAEIDRNYLIIPIIKHRGGKLVMLFGNAYTINKNKSKPSFIGKVANSNGTFYSIATVYKKNRIGGGRLQKGGSELTMEQMKEFPTSDDTPKWFTVEFVTGDDRVFDDIESDTENEQTRDLQFMLDESFHTSFKMIINKASENLYETLYTLYIYECQVARGAKHSITRKDIQDLLFTYDVAMDEIDMNTGRFTGVSELGIRTMYHQSNKMYKNPDDDEKVNTGGYRIAPRSKQTHRRTHKKMNKRKSRNIRNARNTRKQ